jgi:hypothetical protein
LVPPSVDNGGQRSTGRESAFEKVGIEIEMFTLKRDHGRIGVAQKDEESGFPIRF